MARSDVMVRPLQEGDLAEADRIMRLAFGTFLGLSDPGGFMGDADYVRTRWAADPAAALAAEVGGRLVGTNFAFRPESFAQAVVQAMSAPATHNGHAHTPTKV